jgi:hypothetical protein
MGLKMLQNFRKGFEQFVDRVSRSAKYASNLKLLEDE